MAKPNVFIRGIYSTALTKMFIDAEYPIIFPSKEIQTRFIIPFRPKDSYSKDISIRDRKDLQGVSIMFKKAVWDKLKEDNFEDFPLWQTHNPNLITYNARFQKNSIYRGLIIKSNRHNNYSYIRLAPEDIDKDGLEEESGFSTTIGRYGHFIPDAKEGIFQVTHEDSGVIRPSLGSFFTIPGDLIVIVPYNDRVIISSEIIAGRIKKWLFDLGKDIQRTKKYGFIFRTAAALASEEEILEEVDRLEEDLIHTQNVIEKYPDKIGEIFSNYHSINVIFPSQVKNNFDDLRRQILPTMECHHIIKANPIIKQYRRFEKFKDKDEKYKDKDEKYSDAKKRSENENKFTLSDLISFTENLMHGLDKKANEKICKNYLKQYYCDFLKPRKILNILHQKLNGKTIKLTPGIINSIDYESERPYNIILKRKLREGGLYDGLNTPIEKGDYAIGKYAIGSWYYMSTYYSVKNELKGRYFNINTPIEISHQGIRYIDLEIDVVENMIGERKLIDQEYLEKVLELNIISQELYDKAFGVASNILEGRI